MLLTVQLLVVLHVTTTFCPIYRNSYLLDLDLLERNPTGTKP